MSQDLAAQHVDGGNAAGTIHSDLALKRFSPPEQPLSLRTWRYAIN